MLSRQMIVAVAALAAAWFFVPEPAAAQSTATWTTCAREGQFCSFSGTRIVRYGANNTWVVRELQASNGGVRCSNAVFGDPLPGVWKTCQLQNVPRQTTTWVFCANEGSRCNFTGTRRIRYGAGDRWVTRELRATNGGVACSNRVFGDPAPGVWKRCEIASTSGGGGSSDGTAQRPPTISGTPATSVAVGEMYRFQPTASDPNGDRLTFSITNRPSWASFDTSTGLLTGQPTLAHVGTYSNIVISVSDGTSRVQLPPFSISVVQSSSGTATLSWTPPTRNTDGTPLTNLAGYRIYYGTSANALTRQIQVANPGLSTYVISDLSRGTWYFAVRAYNTAGVESDSSNVVSKTIR
ncbi:MAG: putative Ig domain-containing protein [Gammaproteobacteria bacterium]